MDPFVIRCIRVRDIKLLYCVFYSLSGFPRPSEISYKPITDASHREVCCFESQTMVGVPTVSFLDEGIRSSESLNGMDSYPFCLLVDQASSMKRVKDVRGFPDVGILELERMLVIFRIMREGQ
jgi:hypothetical protein